MLVCVCAKGIYRPKGRSGARRACLCCGVFNTGESEFSLKRWWATAAAASSEEKKQTNGGNLEFIHSFVLLLLTEVAVYVKVFFVMMA